MRRRGGGFSDNDLEGASGNGSIEIMQVVRRGRLFATDRPGRDQDHGTDQRAIGVAIKQVQILLLSA